MKNALQKIDKSLYRVESGFIVTLLLGLVGAGVLQILLRRLTDFAIPDLEISMRWAVVWLTFFGASLATRQSKHVSVDAIGRLFHGLGKIWLNIFIDLFSLFIVVLLAYTSWSFVLEEREFGTTVMNDLPAWIIEIIFPLGFGLIAFRLILKIILNLLELRKKREG